MEPQIERNPAGEACRLIAEYTGREASELLANQRLREDLGTDSIADVEIMMAMEEALGIEIDDDEAETVRTVGDAIALAERKCNAKLDGGGHRD